MLEGRFGLYHAFVGAEQGEIPIDAQLADLGSRWETPRIAYKPYPACHFIHGSLGADRRRSRRSTRTRSRTSLVTIPAAGVSLVLEPAERKIAPRTVYEAKFSLQYSTAAMLVHGRVGLSAFSDEAIADPRVLDLARQGAVRDEGVRDLPGRVPGRRADHDARRRDVLEAELPHQRGGPENPLSADEVRAKFRENAGLALRRRRSSRWRRRSSRSSSSRTSPGCCGSRSRVTAVLTEAARSGGAALPAPERVMSRDRPGRPRVGRAGGLPGRVRLRARRRVPGAARRADEGARALRRDDPGGVRRARARPDHVRADPGRALARLDVALRGAEHALHLGLDDQDVRHRRAARALPAADGDRRDPRRRTR